MDRNLTAPCRISGCGHPDQHHLATPELATGRERAVRWCIPCRRHEVVHRSRLSRLLPRGSR
ncbi:MAG TPA: hypothetical protein VGV64_06855 [Thermoplasmata archaeon]|nr:hypothetical protein [Thermoplasmata archaeon]